jgi:Uma2 family endonuclease
MVELIMGYRSIELPLPIRIHDVTEKMFDKLVNPDIRAELHNGVMIVHSPTSVRHDIVAQFLHALIDAYADRKKLGEAFGPNSLFRPEKRRRYAPDVYYLVKNRIPAPIPNEFSIVPDLVIEVLSPSNREYDLNEKRPIYQQHAVREIWMVDPDRRFVLLDRLTSGNAYETLKLSRGRIESGVLPGFWVSPSWLWESPRPPIARCLKRILASRS